MTFTYTIDLIPFRKDFPALDLPGKFDLRIDVIHCHQDRDGMIEFEPKKTALCYALDVYSMLRVIPNGYFIKALQHHIQNFFDDALPELVRARFEDAAIDAAEARCDR